MSKVITMRVNDDLYRMLEYCYMSEKIAHDNACKKYNHIYNPLANMSVTEYAKTLLANAIGRNYMLINENENEIFETDNDLADLHNEIIEAQRKEN